MTDLRPENPDIKKKEKEKRIKKELSKIKKNFIPKGSEKDEKLKKMWDFALPLAENVSFMTVTLVDLKDEINRDGCTVEYKNGENQYGTKKNPAVETYNTMFKNYTAAYKQLADLVPKPEEWEDHGEDPEEDGLMDFIFEK